MISQPATTTKLGSHRAITLGLHLQRDMLTGVAQFGLGGLRSKHSYGDATPIERSSRQANGRAEQLNSARAVR